MSNREKFKIMKKILFTISVDNTIDIITNSSSELFVLNGETLNSVKELVESIYPEYRKEYEEIVALRDASDSDVDTYESQIGDSFYDRWNYTKNMSKEERKQYDIQEDTKQAQKYGLTPEEFFENWNDRNNECYYSRISSKGYDAIRKTLDPNGKIFLLLSIDGNPDCYMQEALMDIGRRYHLG